jgi:hypothetical protein
VWSNQQEELICMMCADGSHKPKSKSPPASLVPNTTYDVEEITAVCGEEKMDQEGSAEKNAVQKGKKYGLDTIVRLTRTGGKNERRSHRLRNISFSL